MPYVNPIFAYNNVLYLGGTWQDYNAGNPEQTGKPKTAVADWYTYSKYEPALASASSGFIFDRGFAFDMDYIGMAGHNLQGTTIQLAYWTGSAWTNVFSPDTAPEAVYLRTFTKITVPSPGRIRVVFGIPAGSTPINAGVIAIGARHDCLYPVRAPFTPPRFGKKDQIITAKSESGEWLGRTILYRGAEWTVGLDLLPPDYITDTGVYAGGLGLAACLDHLNDGLPLFFSWNQTTREADTGFGGLSAGRPVARPVFTQSLFNALDLQFEGIVMRSFSGLSL